jgi:hypothetical protein
VRFRLLLVLTVLEAAVVPSADVRAQAAKDVDREQFLLEAQVVRARQAPGGTTGSLRATLTRGGVTHDAFIQVIDESSPERTPRSATGLDSATAGATTWRLRLDRCWARHGPGDGDPRLPPAGAFPGVATGS